MAKAAYLFKTQCPACASAGRDTSKDNMAVYADNGATCFSCGYHTNRYDTTKKAAVFSPTNQQERISIMSDKEQTLASLFRNTSAEVLQRYGVKLVKGKEKTYVSFPVSDGQNSTNGDHLREVDTNEGRLTREFSWNSTGKIKCPLFGWNLVTKSTRVLVVCEGETDALALATYLHDQPHVCVVGAVGASFGKKAAAWLKSKHRKDLKIVLAFDNDKAGREAEAAVVQVFRDYNLEPPHKLEFAAKDVGDAIADGEALTLDDLALATTSVFKGSAELVEDMLEYHSLLNSQRVLSLSFSPTLNASIRLAPGKLVGILGAGGSGKSTFAEHILMETLNGNKLFAAMVSAEMSGQEVARKLASTYSGKPYLKDNYYHNLEETELNELAAIVRKLTMRFSIIDEFGGMDVEAIENAILEQIASSRPPSLVVVDHMLAVASELENTTLEKVAGDLKGMAKRCNCCVVVICHTRKLGKDSRPTLHDEYGSGGLQKWCDIVLGVSHNQKSSRTCVETLKRDRMGGDYCYVEFDYVDWQLHETEESKVKADYLTTGDEDDILDEDNY